MTSKNTSRKVLVPLATMLAAGAIAVGSGASFTSTSSNSISAVTAGTLEQTNSKDGAAIFTIPNMKPGDTVTGSLTLTNSGTLPAIFNLKEASATNTFSTDKLNLKITDTTGTPAVIYNGEFGGMVDNQAYSLKSGTAWTVGEVRSFDFEVTLDLSAPDVDQAKTAGAAFTWDAVQVVG
jgi:spore coat-associated protein N